MSATIVTETLGVFRHVWDWRQLCTHSTPACTLNLWATWDEWRHELRFRFPPSPDRSQVSYFQCETFEDARAMVADASHGLIVRQVAHDRWELAS